MVRAERMQQGVLFRWRNDFADWLRPEWVRLITECVNGGLDDFDDPDWLPPHVRLLLTPRSETSIRHDFIVARFEHALVDVPELCMRRRDGHVLIWVEDEAVATIKKLSERNRLARPNKTRSSHEILSDAPTLMADMPPEAQQIVIGYTVDDTGTQYKLWITCPSEVGHENHWEINLSDAADLVVFAASEVGDTLVDEPTGRVQLSGEGVKRVEEIEADENEEERSEGQ